MEDLKFPSLQSSIKLQQLIEDSLHSFKLQEKHKEVIVHLIDDLVSPLLIKGDKQKLRKILDLLLVSAVDLGGATKIIISLKQLLKTHDEVLLEFTVENNSAKDVTAANQSIAYKRSLVTIKKLIKEIGGQMEIAALEGIGTTIKFLVKFFWEAPVEAQERVSHEKLEGKRILVAEDNEINQKIIAHLLKKEKIHADIANDGKEAIELLEKKEYDLVLLDLQMPNMDGFQTAKYIRKIMGSCIPIIAMTAGAHANEQTRCFEVGINQYLSKPFSSDDLFQRLKYLLLSEHNINSLKKPEAVPNRDLYNLMLLRQTNEEQQIIEILEMFISKTPALLTEIKQSSEKKDVKELIKKTAKLKGSLGSLKMQSMMRIVDEMEVFARLDDIHKIPMGVEELHKEYDVIAPLLKKELNEMKGTSI